MLMAQIVRRLLPALIVAAVHLGALAVGQAQAGDLYAVDKLPIDASGASPSEARDKALAQGRMRAFSIVFKRLTAQANWANVPEVSNAELEEMVTAYTVDNEKLSTTRYLANASFTFSAAGMRNALRRWGAIFSETQAKPVVVLPTRAGLGWSNDTPWAQSWLSVSQRGSLRPVVVPMGDAAEIAMVGGVIPEAATWEQVAPLAEKYGATEVWITQHSLVPGGVHVNLVSLKADGSKPSKYTVTANAGESEPQLMVRAAAMVRAAFEESWKAQTAVNHGIHTTLEAAISFNGLAEWVAIRKEIADIRLIQRMDVQQVLTQGARVRLQYLGRLEQLQAALSQANLDLAEQPSGLYVLAKKGSDVTQLPEGLLEAPSAAVDTNSPAPVSADGAPVTDPAAKTGQSAGMPSTPSAPATSPAGTP